MTTSVASPTTPLRHVGPQESCHLAAAKDPLRCRGLNDLGRKLQVAQSAEVNLTSFTSATDRLAAVASTSHRKKLPFDAAVDSTARSSDQQEPRSN